MEAKFSPRVKDVLSYSREEAMRLGNDYIGVEHFLLGILREGEGKAVHILKSFHLDLNMLKQELESKLIQTAKVSSPKENIALVKQAERLLKITYLQSKLFKSPHIGTEHLLLSMLKDDDSVVCRILEKHGITYDTVKVEINDMLDENILPRAEMSSSQEEDDQTFGAQRKPTDPKSKTPVLDNFGRDLTKMAEVGKLDPIVGREKEIERVSQILSRRKKNNPILIGEPGVGKSAIAEGLALRIVQRKVSRVLFGKRVVTLDLASIVAGTKYRGQFEERMKAVMN